MAGWQLTQGQAQPPEMDQRKQLLAKDGERTQGEGGAQREKDPSASLTIHALNVFTGLPATGLPICFSQLEGPNQPWMEVMKSTTNTDGHLDSSSQATQQLIAGTYKLHFDNGEYWQQQGYTSFYLYVEIVFTITGAERKVHIPLLLSPYSYTTYRGS